jgi:5-methylcytosine-specific restriction endonuclease McrA
VLCACGSPIDSVGRGRPRKQCSSCAPRKRQIKHLEGDRACVRCGAAFSPRTHASRYCSDLCRSVTAPRKQCPVCSGPAWGAGACRGCRTAAREPKHGDVAMYSKRGCRCEKCRAAVAKQNREYTARRRAAGKPVQRPRVSAMCAQCGDAFLARTDLAGRFCSVSCANDAQGRAPEPRFRIGKRARQRIYEDAGWVCQLCLSPVRLDVDPLHPRYPTLDHVLPRSRGGADDPSNLRLACRQCNVTRGSRMDWVPEVMGDEDSAADTRVAV